MGRSSVVNVDAITQYISLNTINLNNSRSYLKSWLRQQTLVSKGENSKLLEAFLKIPNLNVAVILGKPLYAFTHWYWTHSRTGQLLCILLRLCLIAAIRLPDISAKQPSELKLRLFFTLPIIHLREKCVTIVCGLPLGIAVVPREIDDSGHAIFFRGGGVVEGARGKQGAWAIWKLRIRETQVNVSYQWKASLILFRKEMFKPPSMILLLFYSNKKYKNETCAKAKRRTFHET